MTSDSGSSQPPKDRYLRFNQRDDGLGVQQAPRLTGIGSNGPTSAQSNRSIRLGVGNRYR